MNDVKYIGLDVHQATISAAVLDSSGKLVIESVLETKAATILQFVHGLRGSLWVTFEEGTWAAWLYDLLKPHVSKIVVCDPRRNALLGSKSDRIDARKLAELLRGGLLRPVYHGETGLRTLRELARSYVTISRDLTRVMNRLKALYRGWGIPCAGTQVYAPRYRSEWLLVLLQPSGNLLRRPLLHQFTRNDLLQLAVGGQQARLGPQGRLPSLLIGLVGPILRAPAMAGYLSAYRGANATQTLGDDPHRAAAGDSAGDVFAFGQGECNWRTAADGWSHPAVTRQQKLNDDMIFAESTADLMQRLSRLPTPPHIGPLGRRQLPSSRVFHKHHLLEERFTPGGVASTG